MKKFGIIGSPVSHSASPGIFSAGYKGKPYTYDKIECDVFEEAYRKFLDNYDGINVTAPYKELAFAKADIRSEECERIGATNLIVKTPEGTKAYNSDYYGIVLSILHACRQPQCAAEQAASSASDTAPAASPAATSAAGSASDDVSPFAGLPARPTPEECREILDGKLKTALIVGCGGAGKAAIIAALNLGLKTTLMNRSIEKAEAIAAREPSLIVRPLSDFAECFAASDLVIYTIPGPIDALQEISTPHAGRPAAAAAPAAHQAAAPTAAQNAAPAARKLVIEANYRNPSFNEEFMAGVKANYPEVEFIPGKHWLLYQAYAGYDLFTGEAPDFNAMARHIGL